MVKQFDIVWLTGLSEVGSIISEVALNMLDKLCGGLFMQKIKHYFKQIKPGKLILWYYLIWYFTTVYFHFDPNPKIWINAVGISLVIGIALVLSVGNGQSLKENPWQTFRLFWMPFAVSSFSSLIKGQGFFVIFSPHWFEILTSVVACLVFTGVVILFKYRA